MKVNTTQTHGIADAFTDSSTAYRQFCNRFVLARFRDKRTSRGAWKKLLSKINRLLEREGLKIGDGVPRCCPLVPPPPQDLDGSLVFRYSDAAYMKKGEKLCYGYAATLLTDADGLVEHVALSATNASEHKGFVKNVAEHAPTGYDKGADSKANRAACARLGIKDGIMRKKPKGKA